MKPSELKRYTPLKRGKPMARQRMKRTPPPPGFSEETKAKVRRRSGNRCESKSSVCTGRADHFHHRKSRRFGDHRDVNCLHACTSCHDYMHRFPVLARLMGWIVHSTLDPADVPVRAGSGPVKESA